MPRDSEAHLACLTTVGVMTLKSGHVLAIEALYFHLNRLVSLLEYAVHNLISLLPL